MGCCAEFKIGSLVICHGWIELRKTLHKRKHVRVPLNIPFPAVVTGVGVRYDGAIERGDWEQSPYFIPAKRHEFVRVRRGLMNREIEVHPEDINAIPGTWEEFPLYHKTQVKWSDKSKAMLREEMKKMPRDKRGRWMPWASREES